MDRRSFFKSAGLTATIAGVGAGKANAFVPAHNWDRYDFGVGPQIRIVLIKARSHNTRPKQCSREARS